MTSLFTAIKTATDRRIALMQTGACWLATLISAFLVSALLKRATQVTFIELGNADLPGQLLAKGGLLLAFVLLPSLAMIILFHGPPARLGWAVEKMQRSLGIGTIFGGAAFLATIAAMAVVNRTSIALTDAPASIIGKQAVLSILLWVGGAMVEEGTFRGYTLIHLSDAISFWPATMLSSLVFALIHWPPSGIGFGRRYCGADWSVAVL